MTDELRLRQPRRRDERHLAFVRLQPCCVCDKAAPSEAAHLKLRNPFYDKRPCGKGEKPDDKWTTPLCHYHHQSGALAQHKIGEQAFWFEVHGRDPFKIALDLWEQSGGAARDLLPERPKRERKVRPRDPSKPRRTIQSNPTIPARAAVARPPQNSTRAPNKPCAWRTYAGGGS